MDGPRTLVRSSHSLEATPDGSLILIAEARQQFRDIMNALETDAAVKVVIFESAVEGFFLNHSDFLAKLEDLTGIPQGPTGLEAWPDILVRLTRAPVVSIALIRGRATGNGSELALACDMTFVSREKAILSQWEVGVGLVAGGGPMARLPRLMGRARALEVLLGSDDIRGDEAEFLGYVNRSLPDADLDGFVDALATKIASFDKRTIMDTRRLVNIAGLPPDIEIESGWNACLASMARPATQERIKELIGMVRLTTAERGLFLLDSRNAETRSNGWHPERQQLRKGHFHWRPIALSCRDTHRQPRRHYTACSARAEGG